MERKLLYLINPDLRNQKKTTSAVNDREKNIVQKIFLSKLLIPEAMATTRYLQK